MLRVGIIGVGTMGRNHVRVYSELTEVDVVGIADINTELAAKVAQSYHTKFFEDYKLLLKQKLDAVSIAVPTSLHSQVATDAARAGVHILVEKPIADTVAKAEQMIEVCEARGIKLMVGHIERFNPIIPAIKRNIEGAEIISISVTRVGPFPPRVKDIGIIVDLATHDIDLVRYLTASEFKKVYSLVTEKHFSKYEDCALLSFEMENGVLVQLTLNWLTPFKVRGIDIATKEKFIKGWFQEQKVQEYQRGEDNSSYTVTDLTIPFAEPLKLELEAFVQSIRDGVDVPVSSLDGLVALRIAKKCIDEANR